MKRIFSSITLLIAASVIALSVPRAQAATIFNNFGAGDTYDTSSFYSISGGIPAPFSIVPVFHAMSFTPSGSDFSLDTIELPIAISSFGGPGDLTISLSSDDGGKPGTLIESFTFSGLMISDPGSILLGSSASHPLLSDGVPYWLAASVPTSTTASWYYNSVGDVGPIASISFPAPGAWSPSNDTRAAFRVSGTAAVPEPSTLLLLGTSIAGMGFARRRFKRQDSQSR